MERAGTDSECRGKREARWNMHVIIAGYTDEAQFNFGRYRGLAMISLPEADAPSLGRSLRRLLQNSDLAECKWEKVRSARTYFAGRKLLAWTICQAERSRLRVDTLTWDTEAASRSGQGVPHIANLRRMYRALLEDVLPARWGEEAIWQLYPDEQSAMPWDRLVDGLPMVRGIVACRSHEHSLIQLSDLFAGLAVYSRDSYDLYERWLCEPLHRRSREDAEAPTASSEEYSASDRVRWLLLNEFYTACTLRHLGVSLRTRRGLYTGDPSRPLAFRWWSN
jgi:hypothetical protein